MTAATLGTISARSAMAYAGLVSACAAFAVACVVFVAVVYCSRATREN